ncbi:hypothetical protein SRB5_09590 [Streptomyces sp. RB5]|uniref:Uncharacterized protein n=1 Tax=Streptomyces smaragdinus TaxID=2585196 RepID=A0A7K0CBQ2_9ACTN|nr:hypothetical protein [Streptomyces smaragdinus]MQY10846.1 hypothetical protein [Streptomyces smaragdinus]
MFGDGELPAALGGLAGIPSRFGARFRPALLRHCLGPQRPDAPYIAVWPEDGVLPDLTGDTVGTPEDLAGVVLAERARHRCFVCGAGFEVLRPEAAIPVLGHNLARHRIVSGCPACGSDFGRSRIDGLALIRLPDVPDGAAPP